MLGDLTEEYKLRLLKAIQEFNVGNVMLLHAGTMLGSYRNNKLIDYDDDIDIAYISKYHKQEEIQQEIKEIYQDLINKGIMYEYFDINGHKVKDIITNAKGQAHIMVCGLCIDLWTIWEDEEGYINYCDVPKVCKANDFFPLKTSKIYDIEFKVPNNVEYILEMLYGSDWRIPIPNKKPIIPTEIVLKENI